MGPPFQCCLIGACLFFGCFSIQAKTPPDDIILNERRHSSVDILATREGLLLSKHPTSASFTLTGKRGFVTLKPGSRLAQVNGSLVYLGFPAIEIHSSLYLSQLDWQFIVAPLLAPERTASRTNKVITIVIDPGHGGKDPGAINQSFGLQEKDLVLAVSRELAQRLKKHGYRVFLTRSDDTFLTLEERSKIARKRKANLFLSIHFNASHNSGPNGIETFAYTLLNQPSTGRETITPSDLIYRRANRNDAGNTLLAYLLQNSLIAKTSERDRGVKRARFTVIEDLDCPGALIELGFINHPETAAKLFNPLYLSTLAEALSEAVLRYSALQSNR